MSQNAINLDAVPNGLPVANSTGSALTGVTLDDGELLIGVTGGAPVAATLTAGANVTITNGPNSIEIAAAGGGGGGAPGVNMISVTSNQTYTTPAGLLCAVFEGVGAGGAGGGGSLSTTGVAVGSSGGAGAYGRVILTAAQIGASATLTIGLGQAGTTGAGFDGGNTVIVCSAGTFTLPGGKGGPIASDSLICVSAPAPIGDNPTGSWNIAVNGQGGSGGYIERTAGVGVQGCVLPAGSTRWGGGAPHTEIWEFSTGNEVVNGINALSSGAGGSGALLQRTSGTVNAVGGNGMNGQIVITEFYA